MRYAVSALEMAELERQTAEDLGLQARIMMELAGSAVADAVQRRQREGGRVIVACGPGNNGGDGFVAARALANRGFGVEVYVFAERVRLKGDAKSAFAALEKLGGVPVRFVEDARALYDFSSAVRSATLVIDALLGTGAKGDLRGIIANAIDVMNESGVAILAVDVPSGVDADTGAVLSRAVQATSTVALGFAKRGHYLHPGAAHAGTVEVADVGVPTAFADKLGIVGRVIDRGDGPSLLRRRDGSAHKGTFGRVVAVAGAPHTPGAALLALAGALRAGAGNVTWAADAESVHHAHGLAPEVMLRLRAGAATDAWVASILERANSLVIGPGLGEGPEATDLVAALLAASTVPVCLDADGLNIVAKSPALWERIQAPLVLTPHPKEMARMVGVTVDDVQRDRVAMALQLSVARQCTVVLKGAGTVIADSDGAVTILSAGNPGMAVGGSGDVLAGVVGALLANGLAPAEAAQAGALLHACAGDVAAERHGQAGLRPSDIVEAMGEVLAQWKR
ncbi:MAG: NAD(P)H-hydrate dehydratase [Myxococcota bacterium]|nr:NAD(P)H-hydrate dehydratase [Myxococcota bacterium]